MKIYNKIVLDMQTWEVLEEDSYEYDGPLALCGGGGDSDAPEPTAQETALQAAQLRAYQSQEAETATLKPILYQSMGLINENGTVRKMTDAEYQASLSPTEQLANKATRLQQERLIKALEGTLPVSTALENDITEREGTLRETLSRKLGSDYETSTPGIQALSEFGKKADELREASRKDEINSGTALSLNQMGFLETSKNNTASQWSNLPSRYTSLINNSSNAQQPYATDRSMQFKASMSNAQNTQSGNNQLMAAGGTAVGAAAAAAK